MKKIYIVAVVVAVLFIVLFWYNSAPQDVAPPGGTSVSVTFSGTYVCLPFIDTKAPKGGECVFGLKTDDGVYSLQGSPL